MENDKLTAGIAGTGDVRQVLRQVSRFVLGRGSIGEIEHDGSYDRDDQSGNKLSRKSLVAQCNGRIREAAE